MSEETRGHKSGERDGRVGHDRQRRKTHKFAELRAKMSPERRARNAEATKEMLAQLPLQELRHARELTQATIADAMQCGQDEVSRLERRADMLISTLRRYVEAMGGSLHIVASFPDGEVRIANLGDLAQPVERERPTPIGV